MTARHRVRLEPDHLEQCSEESGQPIEFDNAANLAICVIEGVEYFADLPTDSRADLAAVGVAVTGEAVR